MTAISEIWLIIGMLAATFSVRYLMILFSSRRDLPEAVRQALEFVPVAVLSALCAPILLKPHGEFWIAFDNEYLVAGVVSVAIAAWSRHLLLTIVLGMGLFLVLRFVV